MKISLLISAIIVGLASLFAFQQKEKIKTLSSEWEELKTTALEKEIPTDPKAPFSSQRVRSDSNRAAREEAINDFARELVAFALKMKAAEEAGTSDQAEMQKEIVGFVDKLTSLTNDDLKTLVKALSADNSIETEVKRELIMMSIMMLSSENPEAALTILTESDKSLGLGNRNRHMLPMVLSQYATQDPAGATAWLIDNEDQFGENSKKMKMMLVTLAAKSDFNAALALVDTLKIEKDDNPYGLLAAGVREGSQDAFMKSLQNADLSEEQRKAALSTFMNSPFMSENFATATAWLDKAELPKADREAIIGSLRYHGARENPAQWLEWVGKQEVEDATTERATRQILSGWTQKNFVEAGEWLQKQEDGPTKTTAIETYANTLAPHEPAAASDWAETLPPGEERTRLLQTIHSSMKKKDPAAAAALAEKHQLQVE